jgi:arsenite oxidase small subunit
MSPLNAEATMAELDRRRFLKAGGLAAAGAAALATGVPSVDAQSTLSTTLPYPRTKVGNIKQLTAGTPVKFNYPDAASPAVLLKVGQPALGGIGPDGDVVAYSTLCPHKGGPLAYNASERMMACPLHFSTFDPAKDGMMILGQATEKLPRIQLTLDQATGDLFAVGVQGLIYGRAANVIRV